MPLWLVDILVKIGWVLFPILYPIFLGWIKKPMTPEEEAEWHSIVRRGMTKEDVMNFHKNRGKPKAIKETGKVIVKENKPRPKPGFHTREK